MGSIGSSTISTDRLMELERLEDEFVQHKKERCLYICENDRYYYPIFSKATIPEAMKGLIVKCNKLKDRNLFQRLFNTDG